MNECTLRTVYNADRDIGHCRCRCRYANGNRYLTFLCILPFLPRTLSIHISIHIWKFWMLVRNTNLLLTCIGFVPKTIKNHKKRNASTWDKISIWSVRTFEKRPVNWVKIAQIALPDGKRSQLKNEAKSKWPSSGEIRLNLTIRGKSNGKSEWFRCIRNTIRWKHYFHIIARS